MPGLMQPIIGLVFSTVVSFALYAAALDIKAGGTREFTGAWAPFKALIYSMGGRLGLTGSLILGGCITLFMAGWLVLNYRRRQALSNKN